MGRTIDTGLTAPKDSPSREELSEKTKKLLENNSKIKINDEKQDRMVQLLVDAGVKFTKEDVLFVTHDESGQLIWLEKGNSVAGLEHILYGNTKSKGHIEDFKKALNLNADKIPNYLQEVITNGKVVSNEVIDLIKHKGYKRTYSYDKKYFIVIGIGENGFIVTAFPHKKGDK